MTLSELLSYFGPSEASAEIIPQDPQAREIFLRSMASSGKGGDTVRALHARPEKTYFRSTPTLLSVLTDWVMNAPKTLGTYRPGQIELDLPQIEQRNSNRLPIVRQQEIDRVFQHEAAHGVADLSGTNEGTRAEREALADAISGANGYGVPDQLAIERAKKAMRFIGGK